MKNHLAFAAPAAPVLLAAALLAPATSQAAPDDAPAGGVAVHALVGGALTAGGDRIIEVRYTDGDTRTIRAGQLVHLWGGIDLRPAGAPVSFLGTVGYQVDSAGGWNGSLRFERFPIEATALCRPVPAFRFGVGARYAAGARVRSTGVVDNVGDPHFHSRLGGLVMGEWLITPHQGVQLRYVHETYKLEGQSVDGSHGGLGYTYYF